MEKTRVIYARVSHKDGSQSLDPQLLAINRTLQARGVKADKTYVDFGTGKNANRAGFKLMLQEAKEGLIEEIIAFAPDRLSRSLCDLVNTVTFLRDHGVLVSFIHGPVDLNTPSGELHFNILGSVAQFESAFMSVRIKEGLEAARARGVRLGRPLGKGKEIYDSIIRLRQQGGYRYEEIAAQLQVTTSMVQRTINRHKAFACSR